MKCVSTVEYTIQLNGDDIGSVSPSRGLRQGDPLSPYLFILGMEGLSALLRKAERDGQLHGIKVCRAAPPVSHLLFADDCFIFCEACIADAMALKNILGVFESISGQKVNIAKSSVSFTENMARHRRAEICQNLGFTEVHDHGFYLGFPSRIERSKKLSFGFVKDRVWKAISQWDIATLSKAGKAVLLKAVATAIPIYTMGVAALPNEICSDLEIMMNKFFWRSSSKNSGMNWMTWRKMVGPRACGGLGYKALQEFNLAMLAKQGWRLMTCQDSLVYSVLKAKYFPNSSFLEADIQSCNSPSYTWRSIMKAQFSLREGCRKRVGNGSGISIWRDI